VYGHQQALAQCRGWLDTHLPAVQHVAVSSNGDAAQRASDEPTAAAIASDTAAEIYQLGMLASNIEDQPDNTTRFLVVSKQAAPASGKDKTSLMIATGNQPGALYRLLSPLERYGISMTRIESRPSRRGTWDYVFFVDIEGHLEDTRVAAALAEIEAQASSVKVLGAYPCAVIQ
jgi:chorismate mutase/prephenate dehydratase